MRLFFILGVVRGVEKFLLRSVIVWVLFVFIVILYDVENDVIFI
jgi:hypothetical protein